MRKRSLPFARFGLVAVFLLTGSAPFARSQYSTGFESPFTPGTINGQFGWATSAEAGSAAATTISTANPAAGGTQHLRIVDNPSVIDGTLTGAFSPATGFTGTTATITSVDLSISATGGANYGVVVQAPSQGFLTARVEFDFSGSIFVVDDEGAGLTFVDTGATWVAGSYRTLTIAVDNDTDSITYFYNGALIYTSVAGVFAGTTVEEVVLFSDNFQSLGESGDFDNLTVFSPVPEPLGVSLSVGAVVGLVGLYRRKRAG